MPKANLTSITTITRLKTPKPQMHRPKRRQPHPISLLQSSAAPSSAPRNTRTPAQVTHARRRANALATAALDTAAHAGRRAAPPEPPHLRRIHQVQPAGLAEQVQNVG